MYDLIIIGAGPAGITASVYAARKGINFTVITEDIGGQAALSADIENYTGFQFINGLELVQKFAEHLEQFKVELKEGEPVKSLKKEGRLIKVITDKREYQAQTSIVASGRVPRKLGVPGETEFKNRGVTYCATCDGPLFSGKEVAVIGGGNSALDAVLQMIKIASKIYLIDTAEKPRADAIMVAKARESEKVVIYNRSAVKEIYGDKVVKGIRIETRPGTENLPVQGVFIEVGSLPSADFVEGLDRNQSGEIKINYKCETNQPGIFAAGDVTDVYSKQIIVACGEGAKAALAVFEYLNKN